jgi:hypothetical protein
MGSAVSRKQKQDPEAKSASGENTCPLPGKRMMSTSPSFHSCQGDKGCSTPWLTRNNTECSGASAPLIVIQEQTHTWNKTEFFGGTSPLMKTQGQCPPPGKRMMAELPPIQGGKRVMTKLPPIQGGKGMMTKLPPIQGGVRRAVGRGAKPWGERPPTPQELTGEGEFVSFCEWEGFDFVHI